MSLTVKLHHNSSPDNKIGKSLDAGLSMNCVLKEESSILKPTIIIEAATPPITYNYMYIQDLQRYYFIDDIVSKNNKIWEITGHVDVLQTYKNGILGQSVVLARQQNKFNTYLNDERWPVYTYDDVITFAFTSSGFKKALEYLLIVAGG